jgi:EndoU nuclease-like protein
VTPKPHHPSGGSHPGGGDSGGSTHPGDGGSGGTHPKSGPSHPHGSIDASHGISSAHEAIAAAAASGRPGAASTDPVTTPSHIPSTTTKPPKPGGTAPTSAPDAGDIHLPPRANEHILQGDGGRQGGHLAGTGFSKKTEFPKSWDGEKILDSAYQVTQQGPPVKGPYPTKDGDGNVRWAYDYEGVVDGVKVKTTVFGDNGEIRTAYPPDPANPGVIENPPAPNPAPSGVPMSNPPRYSNPDVGGDGSWTWEGPKGNRIIRVVQDAAGNVTKTDLGPYKKK